MGGITCSVSATMTGPGVSLSGSNSECVTTNPSVTFMSSDYQPNVQYCVNGTHTINGESGSSSDCLTTPDTPRITSVTYERILTDDLNFDTNPNIGGGLRMYPDKKVPGENETITNRRKIRIRAKYFQATANVRIYFRSFDPDDPSSNAAPVDDETTTNAGDDNRGNVDGTAATKKGQFSYPQPPNPNPFDCQPFANGVSCLTDTNGEATVDFIVTKQPGDNFTVAASPDIDYLSNLTLAADGINLKDSNNLNTPITKITTPASNACATAALAACRAEMLTVWRRLHLEVDSMGPVANNHVSGTVIGATAFIGQTWIDLNTTLEDHRFEPGYIKILGSGNYNVILSVGNSVLIDVELVPEKVIGGDFTLYDDDDYDDDDNPNNGDENEIAVLPGSKTFAKMQTSDLASENVYAAAYIMPIYDGGGNINNNGTATFVLNLASTQAQAQASGAVVGSRLSEADDFWIAYMQTGYQGDLDVDRDPDTDYGIQPVPPLLGITAATRTDSIPSDCTGVPFGGYGSLVYQEVIRDAFNVGGIPDDMVTAPHELGHQFGLHGDVPNFGIMTGDVNSPTTFVPAHLHILRCRVKSPGN